MTDRPNEAGLLDHYLQADDRVDADRLAASAIRRLRRRRLARAALLAAAAALGSGAAVATAVVVELGEATALLLRGLGVHAGALDPLLAAAALSVVIAAGLIIALREPVRGL